MKEMKRRFAFLMAILAGAALSACGGGGGASAPAGVLYTGNMHEAVITAQNATEVALSAYSGGQMDRLDGVLPMSVVPQGEEGGEISRLGYLLDLKRDLQNRMAAGTPNDGSLITKQSNMESGSENGPCGGSLEWSAYNPNAETVLVTFIFKDYCEDGVIVKGTVTMEWSETAGTMTFNPLTVISGAESFTLGGKAHFTWSETQSGWDDSITLNLVLIDHESAKSYKFENYRLASSYTIADQSERFTLSGSYYDHDFGRVEITTTTPILFHWTDPQWWPQHGGSIRFDGSNASVRMTFLMDGVQIDWRASLSGDNWQFVEIISKENFEIWF